VRKRVGLGADSAIQDVNESILDHLIENHCPKLKKISGEIHAYLVPPGQGFLVPEKFRQFGCRRVTFRGG
jgi:hypothetical protein